MKPFSRSRRRFYAWGLIALFVLIFPVLALYAKGYRFNLETGFDIVETGGLYVGSDRAGAEIYINDELVRETGTFRRAFFVQNLEPGTYTVRVNKEGNYPWVKTLTVLPQVVTEAQAFNMPQDLKLELIPQWLPLTDSSVFGIDVGNGTTTATSTATSTRIQNERYLDILTLFSTSTPTSTVELEIDVAGGKSATTSTTTLEVATTTKEFRGMELYEAGDSVVARWTRDTKSTPYYFCLPDAECRRELTLNTKGEKPKWFDFFPGSTDLAVVSLSDGVYVTELDDRSTQNIQPILVEEDVDFRVLDGSVYIKDQDRLYRVEI